MFKRLVAVRSTNRPYRQLTHALQRALARPGAPRVTLGVLLHVAALLNIPCILQSPGSGTGGPACWRLLGTGLALLAGEALLLWPLLRREVREPGAVPGEPHAVGEARAAAPRLTLVEARQPRIVAVGGGHGLSTLLRGLKAYTGDLTAIVTVADDGGSSGMLRQELGLPPPGDLRDCIAALADAEPLMRLLFQYRFGRDTRLDGHSFGNLFIAALAGITGDFESAVGAAGRVLAVRGRILPSSLDNIELCAEVRYGEGAGARAGLVRGQSAIAVGGGVVERVFLQPATVKAHPEAVRALLRADLIVMGPGSLYTSVLPNLMIPAIGDAIRAADALRIYVCNVATQPGETAGYDLEAHVRALIDHVGDDVCDLVIGNRNLQHALPPASGSELVRPRWSHVLEPHVVLCDLADAELPWRHDPAKLAAVLMQQYRAHRHGLVADATA